MTEDERTPSPDPAEETSDVDWPTWLRTRLEQGPRWEDAESDSAVAGELKSLSQAVGAIRAGADSEVLVEVRALRERVEAMRPGPDLEVLAKLDTLGESIATRPDGLDPLVARLDGLKGALASLSASPTILAELQALKKVVGRLPTGRDPAEAKELQAISDSVAFLPTALETEVVSRLESLTELIGNWPTGPHPALVSRLDALRESVAARPQGLNSVVARLDGLKETLVALPSDPVVMAELQELKEVVRNRHTGRDPAEAQELQAIRKVLASLPLALETEVVSRLRSLNEAVETFPTVAQLVSRLDALDAAIAVIPTTPDAELAAGFHALRGAVNSFVEVVSDIPGMVRRVLNDRSDELDETVQRILKDKEVEDDGRRRREASVVALHHSVIERLEQLAERTSELAMRQAASDRQIEGVGWTLERLVDAVRESGSEEGGFEEGGLHLNETQIQAIAAAVTEMLGRAENQARPVRPLRGRPSGTQEPAGRPVPPSDPSS